MVRGCIATVEEERGLTLTEIDDGWGDAELPRPKPSGIRVLPPPLPAAVDDDDYEVIDAVETVEEVEEVIPFPFSWPMPIAAASAEGGKPTPRSGGSRMWRFARTLFFFGVAVGARVCGVLKDEWNAASVRATGSSGSSR